MQKVTHITFSLLFGAVAVLLGLPLPYLVVIGFAAFIPDVDYLMDKIWFTGRRSLAKDAWSNKFGSRSMHRTFFHNIWAMFVISLLLYLVGYLLFKWSLFALLSLFIGYLSHLILDSFTISGIYWLWPYGDERIHDSQKFFLSGRVSTGSKTEKTISKALLIVAAIIMGVWIVLGQDTKPTDLMGGLITVAITTVVGIKLIDIFLKLTNKATNAVFNKGVNNFVRKVDYKLGKK